MFHSIMVCILTLTLTSYVTQGRWCAMPPVSKTDHRQMMAALQSCLVYVIIHIVQFLGRLDKVKPALARLSFYLCQPCLGSNNSNTCLQFQSGSLPYRTWVEIPVIGVSHYECELLTLILDERSQASLCNGALILTRSWCSILSRSS